MWRDIKHSKVCVWHGGKKNVHTKVLNVALTHFPSLQMQIFFNLQFLSLTAGHKLSPTSLSILSLCSLEVSTSHLYEYIYVYTEYWPGLAFKYMWCHKTCLLARLLKCFKLWAMNVKAALYWGTGTLLCTHIILHSETLTFNPKNWKNFVFDW